MANTSKIRKKTKKLAWVTAIVVLCLLADLTIRYARQRSDIAQIPILNIDSQSGEWEFASEENSSERTVYRYSVIPGGIRNGSELASQIDRDPVVAAHYADFNVAKARTVAARDETPVHVSYRIGNKVFWTAKKVKLARGEQLVTDGQNLARGRCGNRVAVLAQAPTSPEEPPAEVLDTLVPPAATSGKSMPEDLVSMLELPKNSDKASIPGFSLLSHDLPNPPIMTPAEQIGTNKGGTPGGGGMPVLFPGGSGTSQPPPKGDTSDKSAPDSPPTNPSNPGSDSPPGTPDTGGGTTPPVVTPNPPVIPVIPVPSNPPITPINPVPPGLNPIEGDNGTDSTPEITPDNPPAPDTEPEPPAIVSVPEAGTLALLGAGLATMIIVRFARRK